MIFLLLKRLDAPGKQQARNSRRSCNFSQLQSKSDRSFNNQHKQQSQQQQQQQQQYQLFAPKSRGGCVGGDAKRSNGRSGYTSSGSNGGGGGDGGGDGGGSNGSSSSNNNTNGYPRTASSAGARLNADDDENAELFASDFEIELNSVYLPGSKKQNLNHLLNFNYAPRERNDAMSFMRSGNISKGGHAYVKRIKYNKEQYLQAK